MPCRPAPRRFDEALRQLESALPLALEADDPRDEATVRRHIGRVQEHAGNPHEALKHLERSLLIFRELADHERAGAVSEDIRQVRDSARLA